MQDLLRKEKHVVLKQAFSGKEIQIVPETEKKKKKLDYSWQTIRRNVWVKYTHKVQYNFPHSLQALNDVIRGVLRKIVPLIFHFTDEGQLICQRIWASSKALHTFSIGLKIRWPYWSHDTMNTIALQVIWRARYQRWKESYRQQQYVKIEHD